MRFIDFLFYYGFPGVWILFILAIFGLIMYYVDLTIKAKLHGYTEAELVGVYIGFSIPALILAYILAKIYISVFGRQSPILDIF